MRIVLAALASFAVLVAPTAALARPAPSTITTSRPLPTHVNEHIPLTGTITLKRDVPIGEFCFGVNFVKPGLDINGFGFYIAINDMFDHALIKYPYRYDPHPEPVYDPMFQEVCTTDPVNLAAISAGQFTFHLTTSQGSFDVKRLTTSYSPPG